jgi:hypothetical protein
VKTYLVEGTVYWAGGYSLTITARDENHARVIVERMVNDEPSLAGTPELQEVCIETVQEQD